MREPARRILLPLAAIAALVVIFAGGVAAGRLEPGRTFLNRLFPGVGDPDAPGAGRSGSTGGQGGARAPVQAPNFPLVREAWETIDRHYVDRSALQAEPLTYGAIAGMVDALGDTGHSTFLTPEMARQERSFLRGQYVGVGLEIRMKGGQVTIVSPLDGSPAAAAGLRPGEQILKVDGQSLAGLSLQQVVQRIVGPPGTSVTLTVVRPDSDSTFEVRLQRTRIRVDNVSWQTVPGTSLGDLRVAAFSAGVTEEVRSALQEMERRGITGAILDLRNNPGGRLDEAVGVASQFLSRGNVLLERDTRGSIHEVPVRAGAVAPTLPLSVLINGGTASAAEIVAGALQDAKRAVLVGQTTFGTGTVLRDFRLSDGSVLLLATLEWLTPAGRTIWHRGITPELAVAMRPDSQLLTPQQLEGMSAAELAGSADPQLLQAIGELRGKR